MFERAARRPRLRAARRVPAQRRASRARRRRGHRVRRGGGAARCAGATAGGARRAPNSDPPVATFGGRRPLPRSSAPVMPAHSRLFVVSDRLGWSIDDDRARLVATAQRLGYRVASNRLIRLARRQSVFQHNHFNALQPRWLESSHRLGLSYFHGRPGTPGYPEFDRAYDTLRRSAAGIDRIQVTHAEMHELVVGAGVDADRVFTIPIGVDLEHFPLGPERSGPAFVI